MRIVRFVATKKYNALSDAFYFKCEKFETDVLELRYIDKHNGYVAIQDDDTNFEFLYYVNDMEHRIKLHGEFFELAVFNLPEPELDKIEKKFLDFCQNH